MRPLRDWPLDAGRLSVAVLGLLVVTVFFSVTLEIAAAAVAWGVVLGVAVSRTCAHEAPWRPPRLLLVPLAAFAAVSALSAAAGSEPGRGLHVVAREVLSMGVAFAAARLTRPSHGKTVIRAFLVMAIVAGLWSIYQVAFEFDGRLDFDHRAYGFWHRLAFVSYANVLVIAFAVALGLAALGGRDDRRLGLAALGASLVGMVLSYTRSSWLVCAGLVVVLALWRRAFGLLLAVALVGVSAAWLPGADDSHHLGARVRSAFDPTAERNLDRLARYRIGLAVIRDHPILGIGPEGVVADYERYASLARTEGPSHLHNTFLQLLAERGPLGVVTWLVVMGAAMLHALRAASRAGPERRGVAAGVGLALLAVLALGVFNYHWEDWRVRALTLVLVGLAWAPAATGPAEAEASSTRARPTR